MTDLSVPGTCTITGATRLNGDLNVTGLVNRISTTKLRHHEISAQTAYFGNKREPPAKGTRMTMLGNISDTERTGNNCIVIGKTASTDHTESGSDGAILIGLDNFGKGSIQGLTTPGVVIGREVCARDPGPISYVTIVGGNSCSANTIIGSSSVCIGADTHVSVANGIVLGKSASGTQGALTVGSAAFPCGIVEPGPFTMDSMWPVNINGVKYYMGLETR